jgi:beta-lactamase superfamily II metal-dependent hydrolase
MPLFHRELDWLVVASPREEQIGGLARILDRFPPAGALWAGLPSPNREADYLRESLNNHQIPCTSAEPGQVFNLGGGAEMRVVAAGPRGAILLLAWDHFRALLPLGISDGDFEDLRMGEGIGRVTILLLADNGYAPLNPPEWIANLNPRLVLLSVAAGDQDGLPDKEVLETLRDTTLLRTDQNGWVHFTTDGRQMWVEVERK